MNHLPEFLQDIYNQGWQIWSENGQLCYDAPADNSTDSILATLKQHKTEILQLLPVYQVQDIDGRQPVLVPLTEAQKQLWLLDKLEGNSKQAYCMSEGFKLEGELHIDVMEQTIQKIVRRHEALRTRICSAGDFQEILPEVKVQLPLVDFSNLSASEREFQVAEWLEQELIESLNLNQAPLMEVHILKLEEKLHHLILKMHHIISDGISFEVIMQEMAALYSAQCQGNICQLEPPMQFREYIELQNKRSQTEEMKAHESYWLEKFSSSIPILNLPTDRPRSSVMSYRGGTQSLKLDTKLGDRIIRLGRQKGCTTFMTFLAAYKILLHKLTGDEDIVVGIATAGRDFQESRNLVGYCTHLLPIRTSLFSISSYESLTFSKFLSQMRKRLLEDYEHQEYPFSQLLKKLNLKRDSSRPVLVSTLFNIVLRKTINMSGLETASLSIPKNYVPYDLELYIAEEEDNLFLKLDYNLDLFDDTTIKRWLGHFQNLLSSVIENPEQPIAQLSLLGKAERHKLLVEWNDTESDYPQDKCIHQLFEEQVEKTPDAVAVVFEEEQLTYQQLNQRANQLAHHLQSLGVEPDVLVGICVERSIEMVVGLLGILKAGGAYVPLDSNYPAERLSYMLADSDVELLLTQHSLLESLPERAGQKVCLDTDWQNIEKHPDANLNTEVSSVHLAYVIYTSGSTGTPKGVMISHQSVVNFLSSMSDSPGCSQEDIFLAVTTIAFDIAALELYLPLTVGAKVIVASREMAHSSEKLLSELDSRKITIMQATPATWQMLLNGGWSSNYPLKVLCGGEALSTRLADQILETGSQLWNLYGPTEATIWSTICQVGANKTVTRTKDAFSAIGRPIANTQIYILDKHLQPLPIGVLGELYIGGDGLARGYLNRPSLTSEKFIQNSFTKERKLYKTGDLARYLPDGNIEYLGRIDNQVKIRGFRIELGEIEAVLSGHSQIQQAVVIVDEDTSSNKRLVAYIVTNSSLATSYLREYLKSKLPEYMLPNVFVTLDILPLTPNGKIDRKALPVPDGEISREQKYVAPRTPSEEIIANIFTDILGVKNVGIHDNFFELGGHSLLATQLISRLRVAFEVEIPLRELFEYPSVAALEQTIAQLRTSNCQQASAINLPTIVPAPEKKYQPFPLTDIQQAYWLGRNQNFDLGNIATHIYMELDCSHLNLPQLKQACQKLIEYHDMLRSVVLASGEQQILEKVPAYEIEVLDLRSQSPSIIAEQLGAIRHQMSHEVLPTDQWPLFRIRATILNEEQTRLHFSVDALIADAWSLSLLGQQFQQLYENPDILLPPLEISFRDYVIAELLLKDTPQYQLSQKYWFNRSLPPAPELPFAKHPSLIAKPKFKRHNARLKPEQWQQLKQRATKANLTPSAALLTAFADILNYWSKSSNFTINLTLFNRFPLHPQVNQLVGDFTSLTLLEVDNSVASSFTVRAQKLQQQLWQDLDHNYVSGVEVQRELRRQNGNTQPMGVVFTSTLGLNSLSEDSSLSLDKWGEVVYSISQTPQVWLDHQIFEEDGALVFNWDVIEELFPAGLIGDMFASYCNWLQQLGKTDSAWKDTHPQLLPSSQLASIAAVNDTDIPIVHETLHSLFRQQLRLCSQSPAVITADKTLTYEQLDQLANNLGHQLRQRGATPNTLVAVMMEKGWEQIVAVLGILMSGAAYIPISPEFPAERQQYLLEQGKVQLVITQPQLAQHLCFPSGIECLSVMEEELTATPSNPLNILQTADDLAYVIYTSGSTGKPKGVMIDHKGVVNTILDINQRFGVGVDDRVLALSALEFDLSVYDIFGILAAGGAIVMPEPQECKRKDPAHWLGLINAHQITIWNTVPALMQMLVEHLSVRIDKQVGDLRLALLSGDWLPVNLPKIAKSLYPNIEVISLGGATEASIWSIFYPIDKVESDWKSIPYGKPLDNQRFYVLNHLMQPTPTWVAGGLYIGGIGLALGYWQDSEKTKNSFITHPVTQERLYKTGDLGRYLPSGDIEFLGREDFQVKINGYRIELEEIEGALKQNPAVKEAVVNSHNNKLVAYVVPEQSLTGNNLSNSLEASQPEQLSGVILNPIERMEFKLKQLGLRKFSSQKATVDLPLSEIDEVKRQAYLERQSYRQFLPEPVPLEDFSEFLSCLLQIKMDDFPLPKYRYPSAGNLYPVQAYLWIQTNGVQGLDPGIYYYHPGEHRLILVNTTGEIEGDIYGNNQPVVEESAFSIFLIGKISSIAPMYGEKAKDFCLLEAGHIGQLLMQSAPKKEIGLCPIGSLEFSSIESKFELESNQILLYSFVGGKISPAQTKYVSSSQPEGSYKSISAEMHKYLKHKLPEYMVPSECVILDTLPLTPNGKIDRKALPIPDREIPREQKYVAPRTQSEEIIANIFADVLGVKNTGIHDNFFELGGHSLLATQVISRLRQSFSVEITLRELFEYPTVAGLEQVLTQQKYASDRLLNLPPIQPRNQTSQIPLSYAQERLWFLEQLEGQSDRYVMPKCMRICGDLDINALHHSLSEIVRRHKVLRTSFKSEDGRPIQIINPEATINMNLVDLQQLEAREREIVLYQHIQQEYTTPFNLEKAPLIRCSLLKLDAKEHALLIAIHHIVYDGWSDNIFNQELLSLYQAFAQGEPSPLRELPIQYADFTLWQKQFLNTSVLENQLNYWKQQLDAAPDLLQLPIDRSRPAVQTYRGAIQDFSLNTDLTQKLKTLARKTGTTLFMILYAALATLLYRYSGQSDILISTLIANRNHGKIEELIGFFQNILILRTLFEDNPTFENLLMQVKETTLKAYENQDVPFEQVVKALQPQRSLSYPPLLQVMLILENMPMDKLELPSTTLSPLYGEHKIAVLDLTLFITEIEQKLECKWEYNTDLFDGSTIERMATHYQNLLSAIVENYSMKVSELPLLSEAEQYQLSVEWNDTNNLYSRAKCIHQLFEEQVKKTSDAIAVVFDTEQLTYQQLNQRANQLAYYLQTLGVKPETLVGICVERSLEMLVGLLGILKAGGAYVPLDPNYPQESLSYMLKDSGVGVLLTTQELAESLSEHQAQVVCLDTDWGVIEQQSQQNLDIEVVPNNFACVIYTSDSIEKPKGVMIAHQSLSYFIHAAICEYEITQSDRVLQFAPINSDVAVEEIYPCLSTGATLVLLPNEMTVDSGKFFLACQNLQLTVLDLPTAYWHQLMNNSINADIAVPESLRLLIIGGEKVQPQAVRNWQKYIAKSGNSDRLKLINTYGSTETTVRATLYRIPENIFDIKGEVPIGRPLAYQKAYILDSNLQFVPIGVPGELYIRGDGLASGYLNHPELTQEKFIQNPFPDSESQRLYKTGDLARYDCIGNIEFLGRIDSQVIIRSFCIKFGEIEAVLSSHPQIQKAVVIATEDITDNKYLVAYLVTRDKSLSNHQLSEFLKQNLPEYMVPSVFVTLGILPLTFNGKLDRFALPAHDGDFIREDKYVAPRTTLELQLTQIWSEVLNITSIGVKDNFFELGGYSLLAVHLMFRIQQQFQKNLPLITLFQSPTIEQLALLLGSDSELE
ncbi:Amino acid adenylation protein (modular protein) [Hyella patelloides LEGE 07179]|uniref:Phenyloxazoline synthase MbtB n=1 Tax=Hyella patelloides LEGE 07179 TaxID=945734 RepID=A0A563VQ07_9CYAN|nr:non-ribosomal peptide synthetase [Hyella patelloides]VEP13357.1 Amino acid adenylation protein (modular protein) [Hyella patelloides LEGE 07179]